MKDVKLKTLVKSAKKDAQELITKQISESLNNISIDLDQKSKKLRKSIKKGSKKLAKNLIEKFQYKKSAFKKKDTQPELIDVVDKVKAIAEIDVKPPLAKRTVSKKPSTQVATKPLVNKQISKKPLTQDAPKPDTEIANNPEE